MKGWWSSFPGALWGSVGFLSCPRWTDVDGAEMRLHIENSPRDGITHLPRQKQFCFLSSTLMKHIWIFLLKETGKLTFKGFFLIYSLCACVQTCMLAHVYCCTSVGVRRQLSAVCYLLPVDLRGGSQAVSFVGRAFTSWATSLDPPLGCLTQYFPQCMMSQCFCFFSKVILE